ncbi:MAG: acyl-coenzyme A thioesterase PaaI-like protein [Flavobacteriales bacterium]|jgi:acyl-coenzyme A thioesterase PaaI-like protein
MFNLSKLFVGAQSSAWGLRKLNFVLHRGIPFNAPHKISIVQVSDKEVRVAVPYIKKNLNHLKGIHACCLATVAEYTTGLVMLNALDPQKYRLIMQSIEVSYFYQAKGPVEAKFSISDSDMRDKIIAPLEKEGVVMYRCEILIHDLEGNHICTGKINWQIKQWSKVKTKV